MLAPTSTHSPSNEGRRAPSFSSSQWAWSLVADWLALGLGFPAHCATPLRPHSPTLNCHISSFTALTSKGLKLITAQGLSDPTTSCSSYLPATMIFSLISKQCQFLAQCHSFQFPTCPNSQQFQNPCEWIFQHHSLSLLWAALHWCELLSSNLPKSHFLGWPYHTWASVLKLQIRHLPTSFRQWL